jgi:hypothetical protein
VTTSASERALPIPAGVSELTPEWFSQVLDSDVAAVDVIEAHAGVGLLEERLWVASHQVRRV